LFSILYTSFWVLLRRSPKLIQALKPKKQPKTNPTNQKFPQMLLFSQNKKKNEAKQPLTLPSARGKLTV
jgi:hypothetical protein